MSRVLSNIQRLADNEIVQDVAALLAMVAFLVFVTAGSAGVCIAITNWRLGQ